MKRIQNPVPEKSNSLLTEVTSQEYNFSKDFKQFAESNNCKSRNNYAENSQFWQAIDYEECALDFLPINDHEYLMIDKEYRKIIGTYTAKCFEEDVRAEKTITSILLADQWDIRKMLSIICQKRWNYIYFVMNDAAPKFASFFKVKEFLSTLPQNVKFFVDTDEMERFFLEDNDVYLPRKIVASEPNKYKSLFDTIHKRRIRNRIPSKNVFLSICIPTYNRGELALRAVRVALSSEFDAEIEILVCDNGSDIEMEAYGEIANINDSRLIYNRSVRNNGYMYNFSNCVKKASGHFALFFSDEDLIIPGNIGSAIKQLINIETVGACVFSGAGYSDLETKIYKSGIEATIRACNMNYITGTCLNLRRCGNSSFIDQLNQFTENRFVERYTHCTLALLLSFEFDICDSSIKVWQLGDQVSPVSDCRVGKWYAYDLPDDRFRQEIGIMEIATTILSGDDLVALFISRINATFGMISEAYKFYGLEFANEYTWIKIWKQHYNTCLQILQMLNGKNIDMESLFATMSKAFFYWSTCKREQRLRKPEENLLPSLQSQVAKYYYDKGTPIENIDFDRIKKDLTPLVEQFLEERS